MGIYPKDDTFQEFSTPYGARLCSYIRHEPWAAADTTTDYEINTSTGDPHGGYSTSYRVASFKSQVVSGSTPSMSACLWRQAYLTNCKASLTFRMLSVAGSPTFLDFRFAGVCVRTSGGSFIETVGQQSVYDTTGYWMILACNPSLGGPLVRSKWLLLRVNSGSITVLATKEADQEVQNTLTGAHQMQLEVADVSGNPVLQGYYDGVRVFQTSGVTDSHANRITSAGRCGFGMCRDRQVSGNNTATIASRFTVYDSALGTQVLADDFLRQTVACNPLVTDGNGVSGKVMLSMWTLDIHGPTGFISNSNQLRDPSLNRIDCRGGTCNFPQIPATNAYTQARSIVYRRTATEAGLVSTGVMLRSSFGSAGGLTNGYVLTVNYQGSSSLAAIYRYNSSSATLLCTADVSSGYGLALGVDYQLLGSVRSSGTSETSGTPLLTVSLNGTLVTAWTPLASGVTELFGQVFDGSAAAILQGSSQGLYLIPPTGANRLYYKLWTDQVPPDPTGEGEEENQPSYPIGSECDGKLGAWEAPIGSKFEVEQSNRVNLQRYESGHVARVMFDRFQRRRWRIELPAMTDDERDDLWLFWNRHGKSIPFDWTDPEDGTVMCAHFADDGLSTLKIGPAASSYSCVVEELLESATFEALGSTGSGVVGSPGSGSSPGVAYSYVPGPAFLAVTAFAPNVLAQPSPGPAQLTITTFAPRVSNVIIPNTRHPAFTMFAPTVLYGKIVEPNTRHPVFTCFPPVVSNVFIPNTRHPTITCFAPTVIKGKFIIPNTRHPAFTTFAPTVTSS